MAEGPRRRALDYDEITRYLQIVAALGETLALTSQIDTAIARTAAGPWHKPVGGGYLPARLAARTVLRMSMAMVIGADAAGHGGDGAGLLRHAGEGDVADEAGAAFLVASGMRFTPTSMTTAPSRTMRAVTNSGTPWRRRGCRPAA